jgi:hypothetical membrane protein
MQEAAIMEHTRVDKLNFERITIIIFLHTIGQFILLPMITHGGLAGLKTLEECLISLIITAILILVSILARYNSNFRNTLSIISVIGICVCLVTICYLILSEPYGQWTIDRFSDLGTGKHLEAGFRMEIIWLIAAINFFVALYLLYRVISLKSFQNYAFLFLLLFYTIMYVDFAIQKMPRACECDYKPFNDIEDIVYSDSNFDENTRTISACYYKYRFMFIKFGHHCDK